MLQGIIIKKIINLVLRKILKKYDLDNISDYVNNKNDLDWKVEILDKKIITYKAILPSGETLWPSFFNKSKLEEKK